MEFSRLMKFSPLVGAYAFYNVFATSAPTDPWTAMQNAIKSFVADPITKLKAKTQNLTTLAIVILGVPILTKAMKIRPGGAVGMIVKLTTYYIIGDQLAALLNGPGRFGAMGWGGETSAYHQPMPSYSGYVDSSNFQKRR